MTVLELAQQFIAIDSVTTHSNGDAAEWLAERLRKLGFRVQLRQYVDLQGVSKTMVSAVRLPSQGAADSARARPVAYSCHTDVVPVDQWDCPHGGPFEAVVAEGRLWGRGACDMKGPIAAALSALERIEQSAQLAPIYFFATGDEECGMVGAEILAQEDAWYAELRDSSGVLLIGEPTLLRPVNAHKGVCRIDVIARGVAAHSSTRAGRNANWALIPFLQELLRLHDASLQDPAWQNPSFDPSDISLNLVIENVPAAVNITVAEASCRLFFRPMPSSQIGLVEVKDKIHDMAARHGLEAIDRRVLPPMFTKPDRESLQVVLGLTGQTEPLAVSYATDGCCFGDLEDRIVIGPGSIEQAHRPDEWIAAEQLEHGASLYEQVLRRFACVPE